MSVTCGGTSCRRQRGLSLGVASQLKRGTFFKQGPVKDSLPLASALASCKKRTLLTSQGLVYAPAKPLGALPSVVPPRVLLTSALPLCEAASAQGVHGDGITSL